MKFLVMLVGWSKDCFPDTVPSLEKFYSGVSKHNFIDAVIIETDPNVIDRCLKRFYNSLSDSISLTSLASQAQVYLWEACPKTFKLFRFPGESPENNKYRGFPTENAISFRNGSDPYCKPFILIAEPVETFFQNLDDVETEAELNFLALKYPEEKRSRILRVFSESVKVYTSIIGGTETETAEADSFPSSEQAEPAADSAETATETPNDSESDAADSIDNLPYSIADVPGKPSLPPEALAVLKQAYKDFSSIPYRNEKEPPDGWVRYEGKPSAEEFARIRAEAKRQPQALVELKDGGGTYLVGWSDSGRRTRLWCKQPENNQNYRYFFIDTDSKRSISVA